MDKRTFTLQLLAEVSGNPSRVKGSAPQPSPAKHRGKTMRICPKLLVLSDAGNAAALQEAETLRKCGYAVQTCTDPMAPMPESPDLVVVIPSPSLTAEIALGLQTRPMAAAVLQALWKGTPVWADFSALAGSASPALQALYAGYADRLREFGVKEIFPGHYDGAAAQTFPEAAASPAAPAGQRTVITAGDILSFAGKHLEVPENAVITPLARETANKRGVVIEKVHSRRD